MLNIPRRYLMGYPPKKTKIRTIKNNKTEVDKLAGKINNITIKTGSQSFSMENFNRFNSGLSLDIK